MVRKLSFCCALAALKQSRYRGPICCLTMLIVVGACAVPEHMSVRAGADPRNVDDDVRFRTTYYFRVFDACRQLEDEGAAISEEDIVPDTDSLYRFRMTGKAFSLFTNVHFEAGTLNSFEIDPFGANVVFDEKSNRFHFKSRRQTELEAARQDDYAELDRLLERRKRMNGNGFSSDLKAKLDALIDRKLSDLAGHSVEPRVPPSPSDPDDRIQAIQGLAQEYENLSTIDSGAGVPAEQRKSELIRRIRLLLLDLERSIAFMVGEVDRQQGQVAAQEEWETQIRKIDALADHKVKRGDEEVPISDKIGFWITATKGRVQFAKAKGLAYLSQLGQDALSDDASELCPPGKILRRGFQIMGPEGWRTFNQDERLILAMSSSGKPLISALKEISARVLNEQSDESAALLPLVQERLHISRARRKLDALETDSRVTDPKGVAIGELVKEVIDTFDEGRADEEEE